MLVISREKFRTVAHIWFEKKDSVDVSAQKCDVLVIHGHEIPLQGKWIISQRQNSMLTNLTLDEEELFRKATKTVRNEINRCKKENIEVKVYTSEDILVETNILSEFSEVYRNMYKEKGMDISLNVEELISYARADCLLLSVAMIANKPMVFHSYIYDGNNSRFLQSCSEFRINEKNLKNAIGRANKYLHWCDFAYLKKLGIKNYDWGGISNPVEPTGIDKFKIAFGGEPVEYYNIIVRCSFKARVFEVLKQWKIKK